MPDIMIIGARGIPDVQGGAEKNAEKTFPILVERGYTVEFVGIKANIRQSSFKGIALKGLPTFQVMKSDKVVYNFLALLYAAVKRPRLVHLQALNSGMFLFLYKLLGLRVVLRYGSSDTELKKWSPVQRLLVRVCEFQLRYANHVIAVSEKFKTDLLNNQGLRRVDVIPNGIDPVESMPAKGEFWDGLNIEKGKFVLSVGRLTVQKDFETLIEAIRLLEDKTVKLVIAGGPAELGYSDKLLAMADDRIKFTGFIDRELLGILYANCGAYAHCSRHEGLSNAVLEAISYQCALVVSDIPANTEMPLQPNSYFPVGDASTLQDKLKLALAKPDDYMADSGNFCDWPTVADRTEAVYETIIGRRDPNSGAWSKPAAVN